MADKDTFTVLKFRNRPWYIWALRAVWFLWVLFWAEVMVGSGKEAESRAFVISLVIFLVSLVAGISLWLWGYLKFKKART